MSYTPSGEDYGRLEQTLADEQMENQRLQRELAGTSNELSFAQDILLKQEQQIASLKKQLEVKETAHNATRQLWEKDKRKLEEKDKQIEGIVERAIKEIGGCHNFTYACIKKSCIKCREDFKHWLRTGEVSKEGESK